MIIAGIDPATKAKDHAISILKDNKVVVIYKSHNIPEINEIFLKWGVEKVYIENQFFSVNPKTLKDLAHETGKIMGILELLETPYDLVAPVSWQAYHNIPRKDKSLSAYNWKKQHQSDLIYKATLLSNYVIKDDDEACSVLIALYGGQFER